jgi:predicted dehydrogenase
VAASSGVCFAEAFHNLYHPLLLTMREIVRSGALGRVERVQCVFNTTIRRKQDIRFEYALGGGAMMDLGCYLVSLTRFVLGAGTETVAEPRVADARAEMLAPDVDGAMHALLHMPQNEGKPIAVELACAMRRWSLPRLTFDLAGTHGEMHVINPVLPQVWNRLTVRTAAGKQRVPIARASTYERQLAAFVQAARTGIPLPTSVDEGVRNMQAIDAIYRAAGLRVRGE